jgi:hypothetical protein
MGRIEMADKKEFPFQTVRYASPGFSRDEWTLVMVCGHTITGYDMQEAPERFRCYRCKPGRGRKHKRPAFKDPRDGFEAEKKVSPHWRRP